MSKIANFPSRKSKKRAVAQLLALWQQQHEGDVIEPHEIAPWALANGHWDIPMPTREDLLKRDIQGFLKGERHEDPEGRRVRKYQTVRTESGHSQSWFIFDTPPPKMRESLARKIRSAESDVKQIETDRESYNDHNKFGAQLPLLDYNFNNAVEEAKHPDSYPTKRPEDEGGDDDKG